MFAVVGVTALFFALDLWWRVAEAVRVLGVVGRRVAVWAGVGLGAWVGLALLATLSSALNDAMRSIPLLPIALSLACIAALLLMGLAPAFRRAFDAVPMPSLMAFFYWRAIFGGLLLAAYAAGRLPAAFGIPAGIGDMAVTMLAIVVLALKPVGGEMPRGPIWLWNAIGLLDLLYVAFLAATVLRPWAAQRGLPTNFVLLNFVVPAFIAIHLHMFGRLWRESKSASGRVGKDS
jgi:hypothetical protein